LFRFGGFSGVGLCRAPLREALALSEVSGDNNVLRCTVAVAEGREGECGLQVGTGVSCEKAREGGERPAAAPAAPVVTGAIVTGP
jgi:hypothetical protein